MILVPMIHECYLNIHEKLLDALGAKKKKGLALYHSTTWSSLPPTLMINVIPRCINVIVELINNE